MPTVHDLKSKKINKYINQCCHSITATTLRIVLHKWRCYYKSHIGQKAYLIREGESTVRQVLSVHFYLFLFHCIFFTWTCSQQEHMSDPQAVHCPHKLPCLLLLLDCVNETRKANTTPSFSLHCPFKIPFPSSQPLVLQSSRMFLSIC